MTVQPIRLFGDPVLRTPAEPVVDFDKELRDAGQGPDRDDASTRPGVGLAAPQIGVGLRVFTYYVDDELGPPDQPEPRPVRRGAGRRRGLPVLPGPGLPDAKRALRVVAKGFNMHGEPVTIEGTELLARCIQHETDHLDGILFIDRLDREQRKAGDARRSARPSGPAQPAPPVKVSPHASRSVKAL